MQMGILSWTVLESDVTAFFGLAPSLGFPTVLRLHDRKCLAISSKAAQ
jgi:hypothetical protein